MRVTRLSALRTGRLSPQVDTSGTNFYQLLFGPQGHSVARRNNLMKNPNDLTENGTPVVVIQSSTSPHTPRRTNGRIISGFHSNCSNAILLQLYFEFTNVDP
jgi:hypothetical protein